MARDATRCCEGLDLHGRGVLHRAPERTAPKLAERALTQPHAAYMRCSVPRAPAAVLGGACSKGPLKREGATGANQYDAGPRPGVTPSSLLPLERRSAPS